MNNLEKLTAPDTIDEDKENKNHNTIRESYFFNSFTHHIGVVFVAMYNDFNGFRLSLL
jgi:hypothetical protein